MGYIFRIPIPPRYQGIVSYATLENKLGLNAGNIKNWDQFPDHWVIELADGLTPTSQQKTNLKTAISALYNPDVP
jgi:hypothetical protein